MRRFQFPNAALLAGLAVLLSGCSGETPTAPGTVTPPGGVPGGSCATLVSLTATTDIPVAGSGAIVRATVTVAGVPVADGGSVQYSTSGAFFLENSLQTISKTTSGGVADVTVFSTSSGTVQVTAVYGCARAQKNLQFQGVPDSGPVITSFLPTNGSCAGGDTVTIQGNRLGNGTNVRVFFGGIEGSVAAGGSNTQIKVLTPARTLKNPLVPESVPVVVSVNGVVGPPAAILFTYACIPDAQKMSISSIAPTAGSPAGGDTVQILGRNFGTNMATTQVTFCGAPAQIVQQADQQITVTTPRHALANPALSETCDVVVTRDIGLVSQQSATLAQAFTYRGNGSGATCNTDPTFFIASLTPNSGPPDGGTIVTLTGSGFGSTAALLRVDFGGTPATILPSGFSNTQIQVSTPRRTLASPNTPETVDVTVTDLGSPVQRCARVVSGFAYSTAVLDPIIYSISPRTGPNDATTRVSIFGTGFQFPMQVFMSCGAQLGEAAVSDISLNTIVFKTPAAVGANVCLANALVDVVIKNPSTNKGTSCPACFKYYSCPSITSIAPDHGPYLGGTQVIITGHNFEEPVIVGGGTTAWAPTSVSSQQILATTPPLIVTGCADVAAAVLVNGTSLSCPNAVGPIFTYYVKSLTPFITSVVPSSVLEAGPFPVVTITGGNFIDPNTRVVLKMPGGPIRRIVPTTMTPTVITFTAPPFDGTFATAACLVGTVAGVRNVDTPVELDVLNVTTTCAGVDQLVYVPTDKSCRVAPTPPSAPSIVTSSPLSAGADGVAYSLTFAASGGTPGYTWVVTSGALPPGLNLSVGGVLSGTPALVGAPPQTFLFTIKLTDSAAAFVFGSFSLTIN